MKIKHKSIFASSLLLLMTAPTAANADDFKSQETIPQDSVIETSPNALIYENMAPEATQTEYLTITNISGGSISITPDIIFNKEYSRYLRSDTQTCNNAGENCEEITSTTSAKLLKDESLKLRVDLTLIEALPNELPAASFTGKVTVTGSVINSESDEPELVIIPDDVTDSGSAITPGKNIFPDSSAYTINPDGSKLENTGVNDGIFTIMGISGILMLMGAIAIRITRRNNNTTIDSI